MVKACLYLIFGRTVQRLLTKDKRITQERRRGEREETERNGIYSLPFTSNEIRVTG
jgi:hypothetical protein